MTAFRTSNMARAVVSLVMLLVLCASFPFNAFAAGFTVSLTANGQANSLTLATSTDSFTVALAVSSTVTACQMTAPEASGVATNMSSSIAPGHAWYPAIGGSTTFTVTCTDGVDNLTSSVTVNLPSTTTPVSPLSADIKVNGSDGPVVTIASGASFTYSWSSVSATACQFTAPQALSGISISGTSAAITPGHPWYPTAASSTTITITCTDGVTNATDSVTVALGGSTGGGSSVTADIKANGSDGPVVTITPGSSFTYSWSSVNATACQFTAPQAVSGISISGTSAPIDPSHPWYPTAASSTTITITCTDGVSNATDSVTVALGTASTGGGSTNPTVDVKINGSDGPVTINNGDSYVYSWTSTNATACQQTSPTASGIAISGTSAAITPGHPFYPSVGGSTTFTITCTNGVTNATDSAVVNISTPGSSSGGGSSSSSSSSSSSGSSSVPPVTTGPGCLYVRDYMRADFQNNPQEVLKLQAFLKVFEGYDVALTGVYDQATVNAVNAFQLKYRSDILDPWGLTGPTSYTYILTLKKVNELYCLGIFPLNEAQAQEIVAFHDLVTGLRAQGIDVNFPSSGGSVLVPVTHTRVETVGGGDTLQIGSSTASTTTVTIPTVGISTTTNSKGQNDTGLAAAFFSTPKTLMNTLQCLYEFLLILIVLYIIASVLEDVLYKKEDITAIRKRFYSKWTTIAVGLVIAGIIAYILNEYCLLLPLLIALILSLVWMALYPKHDAIKNIETWVPVNPFIKKTTVTTTTETKA